MRRTCRVAKHFQMVPYYKKAFLAIALYIGSALPGSVALANESGNCVRDQLKLNLSARYARAIESRLTSNDPWVFSSEQEARFQAIFDNPKVPDSEKPRQLFDALIEARLESANPIARAFVRRMADDALKQRSLYSKSMGRALSIITGPHYNPIFNRVSMRPFGNNDIRDLITAFHEIEHGYDRSTNPLTTMAGLFARTKELMMVMKTPISPATIYRAESRAMAAQWELVHRIPEAQRKILIEELRSPDSISMGNSILLLNKEAAYKKSLQFDPAKLAQKIESLDAASLQLKKATPSDKIKDLKDNSKDIIDIIREKTRERAEPPTSIALNSLLNAHLTREQFLEKMAPLHGYTAQSLIGRHYKFGLWEKYLLAAGLVTAYPLIAHPEQYSPEEYQNKMKGIAANDIRWLARFYTYLFLPEKQQQ